MGIPLSLYTHSIHQVSSCLFSWVSSFLKVSTVWDSISYFSPSNHILFPLAVINISSNPFRLPCPPYRVHYIIGDFTNKKKWIITSSAIAGFNAKTAEYKTLPILIWPVKEKYKAFNIYGSIFHISQFKQPAFLYSLSRKMNDFQKLMCILTF